MNSQPTLNVDAWHGMARQGTAWGWGRRSTVTVGNVELCCFVCLFTPVLKSRHRQTDYTNEWADWADWTDAPDATERMMHVGRNDWFVGCRPVNPVNPSFSRFSLLASLTSFLPSFLPQTQTSDTRPEARPKRIWSGPRGQSRTATQGTAILQPVILAKLHKSVPLSNSGMQCTDQDTPHSSLSEQHKFRHLVVRAMTIVQSTPDSPKTDVKIYTTSPN